MDVLEQHQVTEGQMQSTDWTTIGARILEAATLATAIHLDEWSRASVRRETPGARVDGDQLDGSETY